MKRFLIIFLLFILLSPVHSMTVSDDALKDLYVENMDENDFSKLDYVYAKVYSDENSTEIENRMDHDFKKGDLNGDGKLSFDEFKKMFKIDYQYYMEIINPDNETSDYDFFIETDTNGDGLIDLSEFEQISYIFTEDSFWDGYSIENICLCEFDNADKNGNDYLNYREFKGAVK